MKVCFADLQKGFVVFLLIVFLFISGCSTALRKPVEFVEEMRNPTSFPEVFLPTIEDIDGIVEANKLSEGQNIKIVPVGGNENISAHLIQVRENAEIDAHYHKSHDQMIYVKKGEGILEVNGTRHNVKEGMMLVIPRKAGHRFINTGDGTNVTIAIFSPPFDGEDIKLPDPVSKSTKKKKTIFDKALKEAEKEKRKEAGGEDSKKWYTFWREEERKIGLDEEEGGPTEDVVDKQNILVMSEEGKQKIKEVQQKISEEERKLMDRMVLNEKLKVLQRLKNEGLLTQEEYDAKRTEIISED